MLAENRDLSLYKETGLSYGIVVIRPEWAEELADMAVEKHEKELKELDKRIREETNDDMEKRHQDKWSDLAKKKGEQQFEYAEW